MSLRIAALVLAASLVSPAVAAAERAVVPGWQEVGALFRKRCTNCHSGIAGASRGLRLDGYSHALTGSENGIVMMWGNAPESELIRRVRGEATPRMPFLGPPLPQEEIDLLEAWIAAGMPVLPRPACGPCHRD